MLSNGISVKCLYFGVLGFAFSSFKDCCSRCFHRFVMKSFQMIQGWFLMTFPGNIQILVTLDSLTFKSYLRVFFCFERENRNMLGLLYISRTSSDLFKYLGMLFFEVTRN